jgi:hypothetical protein
LSKEQVAASPDVNKLPGGSTQESGVEPGNLERAGASGDVHLQTATAVMGYAIQTEDGEIGHVKDVLRGRLGLGHPLSGRRQRESVGGQQGVGVTGMAPPRDVGRVEDALLYRHGDRQRYREREGSDSIDRASADCRTSIPLFERARASSSLSGGETRSCRRHRENLWAELALGQALSPRVWSG